MKRWMLVLAVLGAAAMLPMVGCGDDDDTDTVVDARDDGPADVPDVEAEAEAEVTPDVEDVPDVEAEAEITDPCGATSCPNDPVDGPIGTPCLDDPDCESGFTCSKESIDVYADEQYINDLGGYCMTWGFGPAGCDPDVADSCPRGSGCIYMGENPTTGQLAYGCMDLCSAASSSGVPWTNNCDCRDGYECEISLEMCVSGCSHTRECCEIWHDGEGGAQDYVRQAAEVELLGPDRCTNTCDPCTYGCVNNGCPGGECRIGDPCEHDADCPANAYCISEFRACDDPDEFCYFPGGTCLQSRCDLSGRECPTGSGCTDLGNADDPYIVCVVPCEAGTEPGDAGYPCRNTGDAGPDAGDFACIPIFDPEGDWLDGTDATGFCYYAGNFPGGDTLLGGDCLLDSDCNSPYGLGSCMGFQDPLTSPKFCGASCNEPSAEQHSICETDDVVGVATGVCWSGMCLEACETPNAPYGAANTGCTLDDMSCWPAEPFLTPGYAYIAEGETAPAGFCFPRCRSDAWCGTLFGTTGIPCDEASGVCDIFSK